MHVSPGFYSQPQPSGSDIRTVNHNDNNNSNNNDDDDDNNNNTNDNKCMFLQVFILSRSQVEAISAQYPSFGARIFRSRERCCVSVYAYTWYNTRILAQASSYHVSAAACLCMHILGTIHVFWRKHLPIT
jgi:hypothetical protein